MNANSNLLLDNVKYCMLPKLSKNQEESETHVEYNLRENNLISYFHVVIKLLGDLDLKTQTDISSSILSAILILNFELESEGPWFREKCKECSKQLNHTFQIYYGFKLDKLLFRNDVFSVQDVFDKCINDLHRKLTPDDFKKYPGLIEVYEKIVHQVQEYTVVLNPVTILPVSLLLVDDYLVQNKIKGLKCCLSVLQCLNAEHFKDGNYYEVIYGSLNKCVLEKDKEVTKLTLECLLQLLVLLPTDAKVSKTDNAYKNVLDQIHTESNLYRKAICFNFITKIIEIHGVHCIKWKIFKTVVCDALDICSNDAVAGILLQDVLKSLEMWLKYCWCIWKLSSDQKILSVLFKLLFFVSKDSNTKTIVEKLILTLIALCTKEEQNEILKNVENSSDINQASSEFNKSLEMIKNTISV